MVCSMTGFGRSEVTEGQRKYIVELKSVNNRYLDINIKMPKKFNAFESAIRSELKGYMKRGKVDVFISYEDFSESDSRVKYNKAIAGEYFTYLKEMAADFGIDDDIKLSFLSRFPEVFTTEDEELDEEEVWSGLKKALNEAGQKFLDSRIKEGEFLRNDLTAKLDGMLENVEFISERSPKSTRINSRTRSEISLRTNRLMRTGLPWKLLFTPTRCVLMKRLPDFAATLAQREILSLLEMIRTESEESLISLRRR